MRFDVAAVLWGSVQRLKHPGTYEQLHLLRADFCKNGWLQSSLPSLKANHNTLSEVKGSYIWGSKVALLSCQQLRPV